MLPRLAAMVCRTTTGISLSSRRIIFSSSMAKGTKVISATSLVMNMLEKKHRRTRSISSCRRLCMRIRRLSPIWWKNPMAWSPAMVAMRQNKSPRV